MPYAIAGLLWLASIGGAFYKGYDYAATIYNAAAVKEQLAYERSLSEKYKSTSEAGQLILSVSLQRQENLQFQFDKLRDTIDKIKGVKGKDSATVCIDNNYLSELRKIK